MLLQLATMQVLAVEPPADPQAWKWDLASMSRVEGPQGWTGPHPDWMEASPDAVSGDRSLEVRVDIDPGHHLRIERNFIDGWSRGIENMMGMGMKEMDFTPYRTISFSLRTDLNGSPSILFRIFDRQGGWLDWDIPAGASAGTWHEYSLMLPPNAGSMVDVRRIGGLMLEIRARTSPVSGILRLDGIRFRTDCAEGVVANEHPVPGGGYTGDVAPLVVPGEFPRPQVHVALNMSPVELTMWECNADKAVRQFEEELARFAGISHLEICINPGTQRNVREVPGYLEKSKDTFVRVARWCEEHKVRFWQMAGCEGHGFIPPETIFAVMEAAPHCFLGVLFAESSVDTNNNVGHVIQLLERLAPAGKKVLYFQQSSYWMGVMHPHGREFVEQLMAPRFRDAFVPMWENLLPSSQGLCFSTTLGLWAGGLTSHWGVSAQSWGYANMNWGGTSDMPAHLWFRMFLESVAAGATHIEIEPIWPFDGENTSGQIRHTKQWAHNLAWVGRLRSQVEIDIRPCDQLQALRWFDKLLSAGVVRPPAAPDHALSISSIALKVVPSDNAYKWGMLRRCFDESWWQMGDCPTSWDMSGQVPDDEVFRSLYHSSHFYDQTVPETPFGLVTIVPSQARLSPNTVAIETDGYGARVNGTWLAPKAGRNHVADTYARAAENLPFQADGCYSSVVQVAPQVCLAYLIDPEERFPMGVRTVLHVRADGRWSCQDAMTRQSLALRDGRCPVDIPAGGYRILILEKQ